MNLKVLLFGLLLFGACSAPKNITYFDDAKYVSGEELLELRKSTGMNRREFAEYFEIPYRTVQDWELGNRRMPYYLLRLMVYKVDKENLAKQD